ncbi:MAG: ECF transporter S component [Anaerolineae bacterium]
MYSEKNIRRIIIAGLLLAITLLLVFTRIGFIPVPTPAGDATIAHIPAIIGGILEGSLVGLIISMGFGFASLMQSATPVFKDPLVAILPRLFIGVAASLIFSVFYRASKRTLYIVLGALVIIVLAVVAVLTGISPDLLERLKSLSTLTAGMAEFKVWQGLLIAGVTVAIAAGLSFWMWRQDTRIVATALAAAVGSMTNTVLVLTMATVRGYFTAGMSLVIGLAQGIPEMVVSIIIVVAVVAAVRQFGRRRSRL